MKKFTKFLNILCVACMMTVAIPAYAAPAGAVNTALTPFEEAGITRTISAHEFYAIVPMFTITEGVYLPRSDSGGTNGNPCGGFTADASNVAFAITYATGGTQSYNVQLYKMTDYGNVKVGNYETIYIGNGYTRSNLEVGARYFFKISSSDCPPEGANATYTLQTF